MNQHSVIIEAEIGEKIPAIKALRAAATLDLKTAKDAVEAGVFYVRDAAESLRVCASLVDAGIKASIGMGAPRAPLPRRSLFSARDRWVLLAAAAVASGDGPEEAASMADEVLNRAPWRRAAP